MLDVNKLADDLFATISTELLKAPPGGRLQFRADPLELADTFKIDEKAAAKLALMVRNVVANRVRREFPTAKVKGWSLPGQLRPWAAMDVPDGRVRTVFYLNVDT